MRILITNDDGILSEGIAALRRALEPLGEVFVVAPDRPRSATGHSISLHKPLRLTESRMADGVMGYASNGKPADCVALGLDILMDGKCDLLVSGINAGANLGWDLTYSGTVGAAIEGSILGIPSMAVSVCTEGVSTINHDSAMKISYELAARCKTTPWDIRVAINVNTPNCDWSQIKGVKITREGVREYENRFSVKYNDPWNQPCYWLGGSLVESKNEPGTDVHAIKNGYVSITPLQLDMTAYDYFEPIKKLIKPEEAETISGE